MSHQSIFGWIIPDSRRDMSRRFATSRLRRSAAMWISFVYSSVDVAPWFAEIFVRFSDAPMIAAIGVRSSCEIELNKIL